MTLIDRQETRVAEIFSEISLFTLQIICFEFIIFGSLRAVEVIELEALKISFKNGIRMGTDHTA